MRPVTVWVLAQEDDASLRVLHPPPDGARFVIGASLEAFSGAAPPDAVFVCGSDRHLLEAVLERAPSVRWVHARWAGLDRLLFPALVESPLPVTNGRGAFSRSLAEFAIAGLLYFAKEVPRLRSLQAAAQWETVEMRELAGRTLGIVGYGDIGRAVAERAKPFGMRILGLKRRPPTGAKDDLADEVWPHSRLAELLAVSDDVVVALPLTAETRHLIGPAEIGVMKGSAVFVNVGRGSVVDEGALVAALTAGRIKGAALDVFETEPLPAGHPFWRLDNVLLSLHCADQTTGWLEVSDRLFLANLKRFRRGEPLANLVDKRAGY